MLAQFRYVLNILNPFLNESCTDTAKDIVKQETFGAPGLVENRSEHENGKHIKKYMAEPAMHKHVRDELCRIEITCEEKM